MHSTVPLRGHATLAVSVCTAPFTRRPRTSFDSDWDVMGAEADGFGLSAAGLAYMSSVATSGEHGPTSTNTNALGSGAGAGHGGNPGAHGGLGLRGGHGGGGLGDTGSSLAAGGAGGPGGTGESGSGVNTSGRQRRSGRHSECVRCRAGGCLLCRIMGVQAACCTGRAAPTALIKFFHLREAAQRLTSKSSMRGTPLYACASRLHDLFCFGCPNVCRFEHW